MRKSTKAIFVATFASLILIIGAQSAYADLQITSPQPGDDWVRKSTKAITWTPTGVAPILRLKLWLWCPEDKERQSLFRLVIEENIPATAGSYSWVVGSWVAASGSYRQGIVSPGSGYFIELERMNQKGPRVFSGAFTISVPLNEGRLERSKVLLPLRPLPRGFVIDGPPGFQKYVKGGLQVLSQSDKWWHYVIGSRAITSWRLVKGGEHVRIDVSTGVVSEPASHYEQSVQGFGTDVDRRNYGMASLMIHEASHRHGTNEDQAHAVARKGICAIMGNTRPEYITYFGCDK